MRSPDCSHGVSRSCREMEVRCSKGSVVESRSHYKREREQSEETENMAKGGQERNRMYNTLSFPGKLENGGGA